MVSKLYRYQQVASRVKSERDIRREYGAVKNAGRRGVGCVHPSVARLNHSTIQHAHTPPRLRAGKEDVGTSHPSGILVH